MNKETFNGLHYPTTLAKETGSTVTFDSIRKISEQIAKKQANIIDDFYIYFKKKYGFYPSVYFHKEYMNDWENNTFKVKITPKPVWTGVDFGREDKMCYEDRAESEEQYLRKQVEDFKNNHLGATTERFIELARENGRSEHLGNKVREQEQKIYELTQALMRANEQVAYSDNETQKANTRARTWENNYYSIERKYNNLLAKNRKAKAPKKPVAKTTKK